MKRILPVALAAMVLATGCQGIETETKSEKIQMLSPSGNSWTWDSEDLRNEVDAAYKDKIAYLIDRLAAKIKKEDEQGLTPEEIAEFQSEKDADGNLIYNPYNFVDMLFTVFDIDKDGMPELLTIYGTTMDDKQMGVYTYSGGDVKTITEDADAIRTYFAADVSTGQLACVKGGGSGSASIVWYGIGKDGGLEEIRNTGEITYAENEKFEDTMTENNVSWLGFTEFYGTDNTWLISYPDGVYKMEEVKDNNGEKVGYDYSYFEEQLG